jgi:hypothetical protein
VNSPAIGERQEKSHAQQPRAFDSHPRTVRPTDFPAWARRRRYWRLARHRRGYRVASNASRCRCHRNCQGQESPRRNQAKIAATGATAICVQADASSIEDAQRVIDLAVSRFSRLDILVNNAAVFPGSLTIETSEALSDQTLDTDLKGRSMARHRERRFRRISPVIGAPWEKSLVPSESRAGIGFVLPGGSGLAKDENGTGRAGACPQPPLASQLAGPRCHHGVVRCG